MGPSPPRGHTGGTLGCVAISPSPTALWVLVPGMPQLVWWRMERQGKHVPGFMGTCNPAVPRLALLGCVPMSLQLSLRSLLRNLPLCAGNPRHQHMALQGCPAWEAQQGHRPAQSQQELGVHQSWGWGALGQGPGLTRGWEDPREFAAQLGWTDRVHWEQGMGAGSELPGGQ